MTQDNYIRNVLIEKIIDGDTMHINCDLGFDVWKKMKLRLARINCPEKKTKEGIIVKEFMQQFIGSEGLIQSLKYDKYGRGLCELIIGQVNISDLLVEKGYAKYRDGKGEKPI